MPVLAIQPEEKSLTSKCTPNILPCRINHNGPVNASERYWAPSSNDDGTKTAYFRGRKLQGQPAMVPQGYRGVVMSLADGPLIQQEQSNPLGTRIGVDGFAFEAKDEDGEEDTTDEVNALEEHASFDEIVIWNHDALPDASSDPYLRGMDEWVPFTERVNSFPTPTKGFDSQGSGTPNA